MQHPRVDIAAHAGAYGMPGVIVDGNDVLAVHAATGEAVARARRGDGPSLLECKTYRWHFHAMRATPPAGDAPGRRDRVLEGPRPHRAPRAARARPGPALGRRDRRDPRAASSADLDAAVAFAEQSPFPDPKDLLVDMFAD